MTRTHTASQPLAIVGIGLGLAVAYYAASQVGLRLRLPGATPSVLWPPNAVLTSALLLTRPRRWPILLLAILPAHLVVQLPTGWPLPLILALFVTNCLEAVLAAGGVRLLSDEPTRFDTFRRLAAFFVAAVVAAPLLSSFADAGVVALFHGERYWDVFRTRLFSNALSELIVVPAAVGVVVGLPRWVRAWPHRVLEAALLAVGLIAAGLGLSSQIAEVSALRAVASRAPFVVQLPFLIWAAVRFGPVGTGVALLTTSVLGAWALVHGRGPFTAIDPATMVTALTLSLIVVSATLMFVSTLLEERRRTLQALAERLQFEELLSRFAGAFVHMPSEEMTRGFETWLERIGTALHVDVLALGVASAAASGDFVIHRWDCPGLASGPAVHADRDFPWLLTKLRAERQVLVIADRDDLPAAAARDRESMAAHNLRSGLLIPLAGAGDLPGVLACGSVAARSWPEPLIANLKLVAGVMTSVLVRKGAEDALRRNELMKSAILESLTTGVAVVDRAGRVLTLNENWTRLAQRVAGARVPVGGNLVESCEAAARLHDPLSKALAAGITAVLDGSQARFDLDQRTETSGPAAWWSAQVVPLGSADGGAVVTLTDVTGTRQAEIDAQRSRQALAHVARASTVGELTASLAHQLNQPLSAIMTNAQAARRLLDSPEPDFAKLHAILVDIVKDDRRASDIIVGLRKLLRRGELAMAPVNLTAVIREVVDLVVGDAVGRAVKLSLDIGNEPIFVRGDSLQLQQAVLNLLQNAFDAVSDQPQGLRLVTVQCQAVDGHSVRVSLHDSGRGLPVGAADLIFEPFYTTKPGGMGMGLPIVRSIVEAHGGSIQGASDPRRGTVFEFVLPIDRGQAS
ncbi:MAG TPA: MASE1 domain-containing protein [Vicinamibacterales bacterium]|nr:MASE1 domain-containing protein [Vicinamibacterales bacterium]